MPPINCSRSRLHSLLGDRRLFSALLLTVFCLASGCLSSLAVCGDGNDCPHTYARGCSPTHIQNTEFDQGSAVDSPLPRKRSTESDLLTRPPLPHLMSTDESESDVIDGMPAKGPKRNDKKQGVWQVHYSREGPLFAEASFLDDELDGYVITRRYTGTILSVGRWERGLPKGEFCYYAETGQLAELTEYCGGVLHGQARFNSQAITPRVQVVGRFNRGAAIGNWSTLVDGDPVKSFAILGGGEKMGPIQIVHPARAVGRTVRETRTSDLRLKRYTEGYINKNGIWVDDGLCIEWSLQRCMPVSFGTYANGAKSGVWIEWAEDVVVLHSSTTPQFMGFGSYSAGVRTGQWEWRYSNGQVSSTTNYVSGKQHGVRQEWSLRGVLLSHESFEDDTRHGLCRYWSEEGLLMESVEYVRGQKVE